MIQGQGIPDIWEELRKINASLSKICPYTVGDLYITVSATNPATTWVGTTWEKIEGAMIKATSGSEEATVTKSGSDTVTLSIANLPAHNHPASGSSNSQGNHNHTANHNHSASQSAHAHTQPTHRHESGTPTEHQGPFGSVSDNRYRRNTGADPNARRNYTSNAGGENTGSAQPGVTVNTSNVTTSTAGAHSHTITVSTSNTGSGTPINTVPIHIKAHVWRRLT